MYHTPWNYTSGLLIPKAEASVVFIVLNWFRQYQSPDTSICIFAQLLLKTFLIPVRVVLDRMEQ